MNHLQVIDPEILQPRPPAAGRVNIFGSVALTTQAKIAYPDFTSGSFVFGIKHL